MSYQLSRLDLVVNNATTQITVNTNPSTQGYINGDITPQDNVINIATTVNRFVLTSDYPEATVKSTSKAASLTNLTATELGTVSVPILEPVGGNGLKNLFTSYYDGITYSPQLLTCVGFNNTSTTIEDLSSNNFNITNNNAATASSVGPFSNSYQYASVLFNGTSQSLTTPVSTGSSLDLADGNGNWTIEGWFYATNIVGNGSVVWKNAGANPSYGLFLAAGVPQWIIGNGAGGGSAFNLAAVTVNTWYHFALTRNGNALTPYMNGVAQTGALMNFTMGNGGASTTLYIGAADDGRYFPGYISNVRIIKGAAVYKGNFIPPTINFSPILVNASNLKAGVSTATAYTKLTYLPQKLTIYNSLKYTAPTGQTEVYDSLININSYKAAATANINVISSQATMNVADRPDFYITGSDAPNILSTEGRGLIPTTDTLITPVRGGGSFNGTSQYLTASIGSSPLTAGDFTVEAWFYKPVADTNSPLSNVINGDSNFWALSTYADGHWQFQINNGAGSIAITGSILTSINTWIHIAATRQSGLVRLFVNGVLDNSATITKTITANPTLIGSFRGLNYFTGYISNVRITSVAVYTGNFTVPTKPLTKEQSASTNIQAILATETSLLTLQNPLTLVDNSNSANTISNVGGVTIGSTYSPTWTPYLAPISTISAAGSLSFNGSSQYLTLPANTAFAFGTDNFTVEAWIYPTISIGQIAMNPHISNGWQLGYQSSTSFGLAQESIAWRLTTSSVPVLNAWSHVAISRIGTGSNQTSLFINGVLVASGTVADNYGSSALAMSVGARSDGSTPFSGYISNLRVVKGTAVYTSNFTPTVPLTAVTNTQLLLLSTNDANKTVDSSVNNFTVTNTGGVTYSSTIVPSVGAVTVNYSPGAYVSNAGAPAFIRNKTKYNDPTQVEGYFSSFIPEHTGEEDRVQAWV